MGHNIMKELNEQRDARRMEGWKKELTDEYANYLDTLTYYELDKLRFSCSFDAPVRRGR